MTPTQTAQMLGYLAGAYQWVTISEHVAATWSERLADTDVEVARRVAKSLVTECEQFPSLATFVDRCRAEERRADADRPALPAPPGKPVSPERAKELIADMRNLFRKP